MVHESLCRPVQDTASKRQKCSFDVNFEQSQIISFEIDLLCVNADHLLPGMSRLICVLSTWIQHTVQSFLNTDSAYENSIIAVPSISHECYITGVQSPLVIYKWISAPLIIEAVNSGSHYSCLFSRRLPLSGVISMEAQPACIAPNTSSTKYNLIEKYLTDDVTRWINVPRIYEIQHLPSTRGAPFQLAFTARFPWYALSINVHNPDSSHLAKQSTLTGLKDIITIGYLEISDLAGTYYYGRQQDGCEGVRLTIVDDKFWLRVFL